MQIAGLCYQTVSSSYYYFATIDRATALTVRIRVWDDRMAIMMIFQCDKTCRNLALNQQALWELIPLLQLTKINFPSFCLISCDFYLLTFPVECGRAVLQRRIYTLLPSTIWAIRSDSYMLTIEQLSVALRKQCSCILSHPILLPQSKRNDFQWLCR